MELPHCKLLEEGKTILLFTAKLNNEDKTT